MNIGLRGAALLSAGRGMPAAICAFVLFGVWAAPSAAARPDLGIQVAVVSVALPNTPASATNAVATCPGDTELVGGGMGAAKADPSDPTPPINGLRAKGSYPSEANGTPLPDGAANPDSWTATGGFGGQSEAGDQVTSFALCAAKKNQHRVVVVASINGPTTPQTTATVTATCPEKTIIVGGGVQTTPADSPSFKPVGSYPSDAAGNMLANGAQNPTSWTAVGSTGGGGNPAHVTTAFAVCAKPQGVRTSVARVDSAGPQVGSAFTTTSVSCADATLLGGGVHVDNSVGPLQGGVHLRGSYPSDAAGKPMDNGATDPTTWTGIVQAGGQPTPNTVAHAFAICAE